MKTLAELRASLGKAGDIFTDQEIAEMAVEAYGSRYKDPSVVYKKLGYDPEQDFTRGASMAWEGLKGSAKGGVAALASAVGATGLRDRMRQSAQENQLKAYQLSRDTDRIENFTKDPLSWLASGAGQVGVYALPSLVTGGGAAGVTALAGGSRAAAALAGAGGAFGANYVPATGGIYNELMDQGRDEPGRAALFGAGVAALDTAAEAIPFLKPMMKGGVLRRAGTGAAIQAPVEGATEVVQTGIERAGAYKDLLSEEARSEYYNAGALGVLGGTAYGAAGGAFDTRAAKLEQAERLRVMAERAAAEQKTAEANRLMALRAQFLSEVERVGEQTQNVNASQIDRAFGIAPEPTAAMRRQREKDLTAALFAPSEERVSSGQFGYERQPTEYERQLVRAGLGELAPNDPNPNDLRAIDELFRTRQSAALRSLVDFDEDDQPVVKVAPRNVNAFLDLQDMARLGVVTDDFVEEKRKIMYDAIQAGDNKTLSRVANEVRQIAEETFPNGIPRQFNVPGTAPVAAGAVPAGGADVAGGGGAVGSAAQQPVPVLDGGAVAPVGGGGAVAPVAVGAGPRADSGAVAQRLSAGAKAPRMSKREMEQGVNQWFQDFNRKRLEALAEAREDLDIESLRDDPEKLAAVLDSLRVDAEKRGLLLDPNRPVVVLDSSGDKQTKTAREVMMSMMAADPGHAVLYQGVMQASLGEPLTLDQLALAHQQVTRAPKPLTKERIRQILGQYGITQEVVDKAFAENPDTVTREELGVDDTGQLAGFREADTLGEASAEGMVQAEALTGPEKKLAAIANKLLKEPALPAPYQGETVPQLLARAQTERREEIAEQLRELVAEGENNPKIARAIAQMAASAGVTPAQLTGPAASKKKEVTRALAPKEEAEDTLDRAKSALKQSRDKEVVKTATEGVMSAEEREAIVARNAALQAENERLLAQAEADAAARREADRPRREKARELQKQRDEEAARKAAERKREAELAEARREADIKLATKSVGVWSPTPEEQRAEFGDETVDDAKEYWDDKRDDSDPAWDDLPGNVQAEFIDAMMQWDKVVLDDAGLFERYQQLMDHAVGFILGKGRVVKMAGETEGRIPRLDEVEFLDWDDISMTEAGTDLEFSLDRLGLSHLTSYVDVWAVARNPKDKTLADGAAWSHNGKTYVYTKHPRGKLARFVLSHELGHGVDMASEGGVYSADPRMAMRSQTEPAGDVARELYDLWASGSELGKGLAYPFDTDLTEMDGEVAQSEVFAQLFAMFLDPSTREALYDEAPAAAYFMEDVLEDLRKLGPAKPASTTREQLRQRGLHFDRTVGRSPVQRGAEGPADARNARRYTAPRDVRDGAGDDRGASGGGGRRVPPSGQTRGVPQDGGPSREAVDATLGRLNALRSRSPAWSRGLWSRVVDMAKKGMPYLMTNFQIAQSYAAKLPAIRKFVEVSDRMRVEAQTLQIKFDDLAKKWADLDADVQKQLSKVAMDSTMLEMFADGDDYLGKGSKRHEHVNPTEENNAKYAKLRADFKALPADAQRVYKETYELADLAQEEMVQAMEQLQKDYGIPIKKVKRVPGPYFPLMRFGDYLAIGESESLQALREELKQADTPEAKEAVQTMIDSMERSAEHYIVSAHETRADMEAAAKAYEQAGMKSRVSMADQRLGSLPARNVQATIATLAAAASKGFDGDVKEQIERGIANAMLKALPEMHALQRQAERRGIAGADPDMLRAVAAYGRQVSFYTARLKHAKAQTDALMQVKDEAKKSGDIDLMHVHRELEKRGALNMEYKETPIQDMLGTAGYVWFLGASPTYWAMNIAQPWLVTAPVLAGEFGLAATTKHMARATREATQVLAKARYNKDTGKFDLWSGIDPETIPGESVNEDRKALREMIRRGVIDERTTFELAQFAAGGANNPMVKFANGVGWGAQQIELVNRTATALAAFRLARENSTYEEAVDKAYQVTMNTHMDFSQENTARFMREGGGVPMAKLIFQFRRYQQAMLWLIGHNIGKLSNAKERKAARGTLAYLALTSTLVGGVMGIPFIGTAFFLSNLIADDDDERGPMEVRLRNLIADTVGNGAVADVVAKGVPAAFGMNLGERMSLGNIASLYPRLEAGRTANETVGNVATAVAGPVLGGMSVQMVDAWMLAANGDLYRAVERATPKFVADVMKAYRYQTDGMLDRKGEQILGPEEIGAWNSVIRALGTQSMQEADYYQASAAKREVETAVKDRKSQIGNKYRTALRRGDMAEVRKAIAEFNRDHPRSKITPKDEQAWRRAYREAQRNRDPQTGIKLDPRRDAEYSELMRFAR